MVDRISSRDMIPGFAERLKDLREKAGLSQAALAERTGTHFTAVSKLELGKRSPSFRLALDLASALGVPIGELVPAGWRDGPATRSPPPPPGRPKKLVKEKPAAKRDPKRKPGK